MFQDCFLWSGFLLDIIFLNNRESYYFVKKACLSGLEFTG